MEDVAIRRLGAKPMTKAEYEQIKKPKTKTAAGVKQNTNAPQNTQAPKPQAPVPNVPAAPVPNVPETTPAPVKPEGENQ